LSKKAALLSRPRLSYGGLLAGKAAVNPRAKWKAKDNDRYGRWYVQ